MDFNDKIFKMYSKQQVSKNQNVSQTFVKLDIKHRELSPKISPSAASGNCDTDAVRQLS